MEKYGNQGSLRSQRSNTRQCIGSGGAEGHGGDLRASGQVDGPQSSAASEGAAEGGEAPGHCDMSP